jgi:SAM-dependent methyltransferase
MGLLSGLGLSLLKGLVLSEGMNSDPRSPGFWDARYLKGKTPWELTEIPSRLRTFLRDVNGLQVFIPGCGTGPEIAAFLAAGCTVTAIDFSPTAVDQARRKPENKGAVILKEDFFDLDPRLGGFDLVYERTFLCALHPSRWPQYISIIHSILAPQGSLVGYFFYGNDNEPPPYSLKEEQARELFNGFFEKTRDESVSDSLPLFKDQERWQEWKKSSSSLRES